MSYCVYQPSIGKELFNGLKKRFGYNTAKTVFLNAINPQFIEDNKGTLRLDSEGIPHLDSVLSNKYIQKVIGNSKLIEEASKPYQQLDNTIDNYIHSIEDAYAFNTTSEYKDSLVALVEQRYNKLQVVIYPKTEDKVQKFNHQYSTIKLNEKLSNMFSSIGVTIGRLSSIETNNGRVGLTDFSKASGIAKDFSNIIKISNNIEGVHAISEEFSHLLIGIFNKEPLIQRAIKNLSSNDVLLREVLGNEYEDTLEFHNWNTRLVAEEALGKILQKNLQKTEDTINISNVIKKDNIFTRLINFIKSIFKKFDYNEVDRIVADVDITMGNLAKNILYGEINITPEDVEKSARDVRFNALSERVERHINILTNAAKTETKRYKISNSITENQIERTLNDILFYADESRDTAVGIFNYANIALKELKNIHNMYQRLDKLDLNSRFKLVRLTRSYLQSYTPFLDALNEELIKEESEDELNIFLREFQPENSNDNITLKNVLDDLSALSKNLTSRYINLAIPSFVEFLRPFSGDYITMAGKQITIEDAIKEAHQDISFFDRWLDSMADSSDPILQSIDLAVKHAKDEGRLRFIKASRSIQAWRQKAENLGITSFEWMFEKDEEGNKSGDYIGPVNKAQFNLDLKNLRANLDKKYGKNPKNKEDVNNKIREEESWLEENAVGIFGDPQPNPKKYRNSEYDNLSASQKELLEEYLQIKRSADALYSHNNTDPNKAIQIRKKASQRLIETSTSITGLIDNIKKEIENTFLEKIDDDQIFGGELNRKGITDFSGEEFMTMPALYTSRLENPNEISTDVVGALLCYYYNGFQYDAMESIIDPLEVGKIILKEHRKVRVTRGDKKIIERIENLGIESINNVFKNESNILSRYNDFLESQVYQRYLKDEGTFGNTNINKSKTVSWLLKASSVAQLGFNWLANLANVTTGLCMQNIEAASKEFFNGGELLKADAIYTKEIGPYLAEIGNRNKTSKLALFMELFNIKQDSSTKVKDVQKKNLLERLFGSNIAFLGQEAGDNWLYNRTAIAMALRHKVNVPGKGIMTLWDALEVKNTFDDSNSIKHLSIPEGTTSEDGTPIDIGKISRTIAHVNQHLFGIYNDDDANAANRISLGRLLLQYRKWMKPSFNKRFQAKQYNVLLGREEEGYYRTLLNFANELRRGQFQIAAQWDKLNNYEKANIKRSLVEIVQFFAVCALVRFVKWGDDEDRPWAMKLAEYTARRLQHELGALNPVSTTFLSENLKTLKTPMASLSVLNNSVNLIDSLLSPFEDWTDEIKSGPYKGMSTLQKNLLKSPIPGITHYRQIDRFLNDIDTSIQFYVRSY